MLTSVVIITSILAIGSTSAETWPKKQLLAPEPDSTLVKLAVVFRHGDRTPLYTYPTDPYPRTDLNYWPEGPGQLTINGKKRMLRLGQMIRVMYNDFLGENPIDSYVRSSATDRCLTSAELVMTGAYPPAGRLVFNPDLKWQPIPIHSENQETDGMLGDQGKESCDARTHALELQFHANGTMAFMDRNGDLVEQVANGSGMQIKTIDDIGLIYSILKSDRETGKRLPDWVTDDMMLRMEALRDLDQCVKESGRRLQRLDAGVFLHELEKVFASPDPLVIDEIPRKAFFYSTHETRLIALLKGMDAFDGKDPIYGASIIFEMHEMNGQAIVRIYHLRDPMKGGGDIISLKTRGCPKDSECSVNQFFSGLREFITDEETHRKECGIIPVVAQAVDCRFS